MTDPRYPVGYRFANGTSYAAPMVTSAAAILQAIRPDPTTKFTPVELNDMLVTSGDDIIHTWDPLPGAHTRSVSFPRLNVLAAVTDLLEPSAAQPIYVIDQEADDDITIKPPAGKLIALVRDLWTGEEKPGTYAREIPLTFSKNGEIFTGTRPTAIAVSPTGNEAFVVVESTDITIGDGLLVIDTGRQVPVDFIPFSGAPWPPVLGAPLISPVKALTNKPGMTFSKDGRLLYVAPQDEILIFNVPARRRVFWLYSLPFPYNAATDVAQNNAFLSRQSDMNNKIATGILQPDGTHRPGRGFSDLTFSPDGRTLFGAMGTGFGVGLQRGAILPLNADFYTDRWPSLSGLQPKLDEYFSFAITGKEFLVMQNSMARTQGDEPKAVLTSESGYHVYLLNGGVDAYVGSPPERFDAASWIANMGGSIFGTLGLAQTGTLNGYFAAINSLMTQHGYLYDLFLNDFIEHMNLGRTYLRAHGFTGVFNLSDKPADENLAEGDQEWLFPSNVVFGWNAPTNGGGRIVNQFQFREVFAKRPNAIDMKHDGRRAIAPMFQTGNFCVADLDHQKTFEEVEEPLTDIDQKPDGMFHGWVACTQAIPLDNHLWPRRGAMRVYNETGELFGLPSPDERLLFAWDNAYMQSGRFAVGTHSGTTLAPQKIKFIVPLYEDFLNQEIPFIELGFEIVSTDPFQIKSPDNKFYESGEVIEVQRGGGAVSIINDSKIETALSKYKDLTLCHANKERAFFSMAPMCEQYATNATGDLIPNLCLKDVVQHLYTYKIDADTEKHFHRPRGVAIQPHVTFITPRFGDHISQTKAVHVQWRYSSIKKIQFTIHELDSTTGDFMELGTTLDIELTPNQKAHRAYDDIFREIFRKAVNNLPVDKTTYKIEVMIKDGETKTLSSEYVLITYEDLSQGTQEFVDYDTEDNPQLLFPNDPPGSEGEEVLEFLPLNNQTGVLEVDATDALLNYVTLTDISNDWTIYSTDGITPDDPVVLFRDTDYLEVCITIGRVEMQTVCYKINNTIMRDEARFTGTNIHLVLKDRTTSNIIGIVSVPIIPATIDGPDEFVVRTKVDRVNEKSCSGYNIFMLRLNVASKVSLKLAGFPVQNAWDATLGRNILSFEDIDFEAGIHQIYLFSDNVGHPGENLYELIATDIVGYPGKTISDDGFILHEVVINESYPIGHTMIKGVDLWDGHLSHSKNDVTIPGRGLSLSFNRTYSNSGYSSAGPLVRQAKLGASCRVKDPVGQGLANHPY